MNAQSNGRQKRRLSPWARPHRPRLYRAHAGDTGGRRDRYVDVFPGRAGRTASATHAAGLPHHWARHRRVQSPCPRVLPRCLPARRPGLRRHPSRHRRRFRRSLPRSRASHPSHPRPRVRPSLARPPQWSGNTADGARTRRPDAQSDHSLTHPGPGRSRSECTASTGAGPDAGARASAPRAGSATGRRQRSAPRGRPRTGIGTPDAAHRRSACPRWRRRLPRRRRPRWPPRSLLRQLPRWRHRSRPRCRLHSRSPGPRHRRPPPDSSRRPSTCTRRAAHLIPPPPMPMPAEAVRPASRLRRCARHRGPVRRSRSWTPPCHRAPLRS